MLILSSCRLVDFMMGGTAASISKTAAAPIERVKLLIQNQGSMIAAGRLDRPYTGIIDCFQRTYAEEGLKSREQNHLSLVNLDVAPKSLSQYGAVTGRTSCVTSPLKP
jgi:hypothetical protein